MAQKSKGMRRKTRKKLSGSDKGTSISSHMKDFHEGEQVLLKVDPSFQKGMPHPRFHGRVAEVEEKRGRSYEVGLKDGGVEKKLTVHPAHMRKVR